MSDREPCKACDTATEWMETHRNWNAAWLAARCIAFSSNLVTRVSWARSLNENAKY